VPPVREEIAEVDVCAPAHDVWHQARRTHMTRLEQDCLPWARFGHVPDESRGCTKWA
jgi:hypothetical protein